MTATARDTTYTIVCRLPDEYARLDDESAWDRDYQQWIKHRTTGIGASEMPILLGASQWGSNLDIYYAKTGEIPPHGRPETEPMMWGKVFEHPIVRVLAKRAGVHIQETRVLLRSRQYPWAIASLDEMTSNGEPVEVKNLAWGYDADEWANGIPEMYHIQCNQQMLVTGADRCLFGYLTHGQRLLWEWIPRHETTIQRIIYAGNLFWQHVLDRRAPPSDGHPNARKLLSKFQRSENDVELDEATARPLVMEWLASDASLRDIRADERKMKKRRDAAENRIIQAMGPHRRAFLGDWMFYWDSESRAGYTVAPRENDVFKIKPPK